MELEQTKKEVYDLTGIKIVFIGWIVFVFIAVVRNSLPYISAAFLPLMMSLSNVPTFTVILIGVYRQRGTNSSFKKAAMTLLPLIFLQIIAVVLASLFYYESLFWAMDLVDYLFLFLLVICMYYFVSGCREIAQIYQSEKLVMQCKRAWYFLLLALIISTLLSILTSLFLSSVDIGYTMETLLIRIPLLITVIGLIPFMRTLLIFYRTYHGKESGLD